MRNIISFIIQARAGRKAAYERRVNKGVEVYKSVFS